MLSTQQAILKILFYPQEIAHWGECAGMSFRGHREDTGSGIADWVLAASHAAWLGL